MSKLALRMPWDVLVVEDEENIRELIMSYFSRRQMPAMAARDGRAAIAELERSGGRYGMVITDLELPGADGFAVLEAARRINASCYVVIITGYASLESALLAVRGGAYDYLPKPFSLGQFDVILKRISDRASLEEENRRLVRQDRRAAMDLPEAPPIERRIEAIEATLARIEAALSSIARSTSHRP